MPPQPDIFQPEGGIRHGAFPSKWIVGGPSGQEVPDWQIHPYNEDFYILRQSGHVHFEKPFLYLLFGRQSALLVDSGARKSDIARVIGPLLKNWCASHGRASIPLIVAHSHAHSDHVAGDAGLREMENVTMVPLTLEGTSAFFHIPHWPDTIGHIDLGDRILDITPIPGHCPLAIALYDRQTGVLLTGDNLYPGRLYIRDFPAFLRSTARILEFTRGKIVAHILGAHIEQTSTPYEDYPEGTTYQPDEHELALSRAHLLELKEALDTMQDHPTRLRLRDFTIWPIDPYLSGAPTE